MKALKKVPGKNKGLSKLPTSVRNKMGYMQKGGKVKKPKGSPGSGVTDYGSTDMVGLDLASAERRVAQETKFAKNSKNYGTKKYNKNTKRERVAGSKNAQSFDTSKAADKLRRTDPKACLLYTSDAADE